MRVLFRKLHSRGERGRKGRECKLQNRAHRTFDIRNNFTPVYKLIWKSANALERIIFYLFYEVNTSLDSFIAVRKFRKAPRFCAAESEVRDQKMDGVFL